MAQRVRFLVEASPRGGVVARGIDADLRIEAASLAALEREAEELVRRVLGADRGIALLVGGTPRRRWSLIASFR